MQNITELKDSTFESEVLKSELPVVVDFWAPWCGPCRMMIPVLEALAQKMDGKIKFAKINTDENFKTAQKYSIMAIPTLIVFKAGEEVERMIGFNPQDQLEAQLQGLIQVPEPPQKS
jgi:thioredoxin 1